jgi:hypothetical protein
MMEVLEVDADDIDVELWCQQGGAKAHTQHVNQCTV